MPLTRQINSDRLKAALLVPRRSALNCRLFAPISQNNINA